MKRKHHPLTQEIFDNFRGLPRQLGVGGLSPHELRHTCASLAIRSRASIKTVQRLLGHATATMTLDQYGHLYPDELDQVAQQMGTDCVYQVRTEESQKAS